MADPPRREEIHKRGAEMTDTTCPTCVALNRTGNPEHPNTVCISCQAFISRALADIRQYHAELDATPHDTGQEKVSGSREPSLGVRTDVLDQLVPATNTPWPTHSQQLDETRDQLGQLPAARTLDNIASIWRALRHQRDETRPVPTVTNLTKWLTIRISDTAKAVPKTFTRNAIEIVKLRNTLETIITGGAGQDEHIRGIPCPSCKCKTLYKSPGNDLVACTACRHSGTINEYKRWVSHLRITEQQKAKK